MDEKPYQPKDTGKLTNFHYASKKDRRDEEALTPEGTKDLNQFKKKR
ncbi:hypothetical protein GH741_20780 [Aquibacillus halophilus]|uniref:Uncharacterized protein n=1 Tax=Aquibacillus halophilus TaxID=930132 RepID=A0A6A8DIK0_9BACI|nr:hypothetical protein [Aquibacillus halophilus]MRH45080.1 hypothetical protein [Aquibacillus halophilus]